MSWHILPSRFSAGLLIMALAGSSAIRAQPFTRITTGPQVHDGGASRAVTWVDYDNDGYPDLFVSNGLEGGERNFLYHNEGPPDFMFSRITAGRIATDSFPSDGITWGDVDNDGDADAFVVNWYNLNNSLYINGGNGSFSAETTGVIVHDGGYSESAAWGDYDNDGDLDLFVANSGFNFASGATRNFLYRNDGGTFTKIASGEIANDLFFARCIAWCDYDNDGDIDAYVANERNQNNNFYRNMLAETGTASFTPVTSMNVVLDGASSWSASWGDIDNDGDQDLFLTTSWPYPGNNQLYLNNGDRTFTRVLNDTVVHHAGYHSSSGWGDVDNDGDLDLYVTTGYSGTPTRNLMYLNQLVESGTLSFRPVVDGPMVNDLSDSYGFSWGDYDTDGDLDLFVATTTGENSDNLQYRNDNANGNHWVEFRCVGVSSNRAGVGTKIRVKTAHGGQGMWQMREVMGQTGLCSQNVLQHVGLGPDAVIESLMVEWPSGLRDVSAHVAGDRIIVLTEGASVSGAGEHGETVPSGYELLQNYPNPFNPSTTITFAVPYRSRVVLRVYTILGEQVAELVNGIRDIGYHLAQLNTAGLSSGVYLYSLFAAPLEGHPALTALFTRKMMVLQ